MFTGNIFARASYGLESTPPPSFDFSGTQVASVSLFGAAAESSSDARLTALLACAPCSQRDEALTEWLTACEKIDGFLRGQQAQRAAELEGRREQLWADCRRLEDQMSLAMDEAGRISSQLNDRTFKFSELKQKLHDGRPIFPTAYPTAAELATVQKYAQETAAQIAAAQAEIDDLKAHAKTVRQEYNRVSHELSTANESLRQVDADLNALKKSPG
jgi:chromosome segregation ATPase